MNQNKDLSDQSQAIIAEPLFLPLDRRHELSGQVDKKAITVDEALTIAGYESGIHALKIAEQEAEAEMEKLFSVICEKLESSFVVKAKDSKDNPMSDMSFTEAIKHIREQVSVSEDEHTTGYQP